MIRYKSSWRQKNCLVIVVELRIMARVFGAPGVHAFRLPKLGVRQQTKILRMHQDFSISCQIYLSFDRTLPMQAGSEFTERDQYIGRMETLYIPVPIAVAFCQPYHGPPTFLPSFGSYHDILSGRGDAASHTPRPQWQLWGSNCP